MIILLLIMLVLTLMAMALVIYMFMTAKADSERLFAENLDLMDEIVGLKQTNAKATRYYNRSVAEYRAQLNESRRIIRKKDEHRKQVIQDLNRRRQTLIDAYEEVLTTHTLFPNYRPSHLTAA